MGDNDTFLGEQTDYRSYLLRLWRVSRGRGGWRASLESVATGERRGFANLEAAFAFVRRQVCIHCGTEDRQDDTASEQDEQRRHQVSD